MNVGFLLTDLVHLFARRFTVQERMGLEIADTLATVLEPHGVAGSKQRWAFRRRIEQTHRRRPDQMPAARTFDRIHCGEARGDRDRSGRHPGPRIGAPGPTSGPCYPGDNINNASSALWGVGG